MEIAYPVDEEGGDIGYIGPREKDWRSPVGCFV